MRLVRSGQLPSGGGPGTQNGLSKPFVFNFNHTFRILTVTLASFNRDASSLLVTLESQGAFLHFSGVLTKYLLAVNLT